MQTEHQISPQPRDARDTRQEGNADGREALEELGVLQVLHMPISQRKRHLDSPASFTSKPCDEPRAVRNKLFNSRCSDEGGEQVCCERERFEKVKPGVELEEPWPSGMETHATSAV
ncbi:hypothetical protein AOLI_G00325610 [Acnodon oligacanthus]